ncbi:MAG TPA: hypothetical protein VF331_09625 [Polyangiales bacterium]
MCGDKSCNGSENCAQTCSKATDCNGNPAQVLCTANSCALRCNPVLGVLDATQRCPITMTCVTGTCTWLR